MQVAHYLNKFSVFSPAVEYSLYVSPILCRLYVFLFLYVPVSIWPHFDMSPSLCVPVSWFHCLYVSLSLCIPISVCSRLLCPYLCVSSSLCVLVSMCPRFYVSSSLCVLVCMCPQKVLRWGQIGHVETTPSRSEYNCVLLFPILWLLYFPVHSTPFSTVIFKCNVGCVLNRKSNLFLTW